jgi:hypothetical protein
VIRAENRSRNNCEDYSFSRRQITLITGVAGRKFSRKKSVLALAGNVPKLVELNAIEGLLSTDRPGLAIPQKEDCSKPECEQNPRSGFRHLRHANIVEP